MCIQKAFFFTSLVTVYMHTEEICPALFAMVPVKRYHENKLLIKGFIISRMYEGDHRSKGVQNFQGTGS